MSWLLLLFRCQLNDWRFSQSLNTKITFSPYKHIYSSVFTTTQRQTVLFAKVHALTQNIHKELLIDSHFYYVNIHVVSRKLKFNLFFDFFFSHSAFLHIFTHIHKHIYIRQTWMNDRCYSDDLWWFFSDVSVSVDVFSYFTLP